MRRSQRARQVWSSTIHPHGTWRGASYDNRGSPYSLAGSSLELHTSPENRLQRKSNSIPMISPINGLDIQLGHFSKKTRLAFRRFWVSESRRHSEYTFLAEMCNLYRRTRVRASQELRVCEGRIRGITLSNSYSLGDLSQN